MPLSKAQKIRCLAEDSEPNSLIRSCLRSGNLGNLRKAVDALEFDLAACEPDIEPDDSEENCDELCDRCMRCVSQISHTEDGQTVCPDCAE